MMQQQQQQQLIERLLRRRGWQIAGTAHRSLKRERAGGACAQALVEKCGGGRGDGCHRAQARGEPGISILEPVHID
jgi:hypothetical protein